ncbi:hypothetical protein FA15DRAFT_167582 [Coprinopsis marcescibilis]|uniref:VWFA domain-containing protein n=1 Tax=Coprinopsis marcescibilis TaxID=230819 RepID=A0A5C3KIF6_COPMA|nr:hypothetical protein FA15DRAFT_167582 [Coprinopsis marcescibilis]
MTRFTQVPAPRTTTQPTSQPPTLEPGSDALPGPKDASDPASSTSKSLDIVFVQDSTGSQGSYISSARRAIQDICKKVSASPILAQATSPTSTAAASNPALRFGLVAFRDHPPQDRSWVTKNFGFTSDVEQMRKNLGTLVASGGGDGPEASTAGLAEALNMPWKEGAVKIVVLITDAPPHGLGESGDGFPNGSPDQNDPLEIARQMAEHGISLYVIACEPTLSSAYKHAVDFYRALTQITGYAFTFCTLPLTVKPLPPRGRIVPLTNAAQLGNYIVGSAIETLETEDLIGQFEQTILEDVYGQGKSVEEVMDTIQMELDKRKVQVNTLHVEEIYAPSMVADSNTSLWRNAEKLGGARGAVKSVGSRLAGSSAPPADYPMSSRLSAGGGPIWKSSAPSVSHEHDEDDADDLPVDALLVPRGAPGAPIGRERRREARGRPRMGSPLSSAPPPPPTMYASAPVAFNYLPTSAPSRPQASLAPQAIDRNQTKRVVMQGLMRNAKVGAGGVLQPTGAYADKGPVKLDG